MPSTVPVHGVCAGGFEPVRDAFGANFAEHGEVGAACVVMVGSEVVVDLWGGWADPAESRPWERDTLVDAYSVGKPVVATLVLQLVDADLVDLDEPVASYWPEFAAAGKGAVTVRHALSHTAGVPAIREPLTNDDLWDFDRMCSALAATEPWFPAGARVVYHTNTYGHLAGGIVRAVTGETPGRRLAPQMREIDAGVHFGVPDDQLHRCAHVDFVGGDAFIDPDDPGLEPDARMTMRSYVNPPGYSSLGVVNTAEWRRAEVPSTNGHMSALGVARFYDAVRTGRLLGDDIRSEATRPQSSGFCPTLGQDVVFGLGFKPWTERRPFGHNPGGFGHHGTGGALGFADPTAEVAFGYVMNHVIPRWQSPRNRALVDAVYGCL